MDDRTDVYMSGPSRVEVASAHLKRISWGAVFAGAVVTIVVWMTLALLGMAVGFSAIDPAEEGTIPGMSLGVGAMIWWIISSLIALFVGGWVAGRLAGPQRRLDGALHGMAAWGLGALATVFMLTSAVGGIVGGAFGVVSNTLNFNTNDLMIAQQQLMRGLGGDDRDFDRYGSAGYGRWDNRDYRGSGDMASRDFDRDDRSMGTGATGMGTQDYRDRDRDRDGVGISGGVGADRSGGGAGVSGRAGDASGSAGIRVDRRGVTGTVGSADDDDTTRMSGTIGPGGISGSRTTDDADRTGTAGTMADANRNRTTTGTGGTGMGTGTTGDIRRGEARDMDDDEEGRAAFATREQRMAENAAETASKAAMYSFIMLLLGLGAALWGGWLGSPRDVTIVAASSTPPPPLPSQRVP